MQPSLLAAIVSVSNLMAASLVPRPCPAFHHLQSTESWVGPGNEAIWLLMLHFFVAIATKYMVSGERHSQKRRFWSQWPLQRVVHYSC